MFSSLPLGYLCFARCVFSVLLHVHFTFFNLNTYIYLNVVVHIIVLMTLLVPCPSQLKNQFMCVYTAITYTQCLYT